MDDTFLSPDKRISAENKDILDVAYAHGIQFVPCTGRNVAGIPAELSAHPSVRYSICCNGAIIYDFKRDCILYEDKIDKELVISLYSRIASLPITFDLFSNDRAYAARDRWHIFNRLPLEINHLVQIKSNRTPFDGTTGQLIESIGSICRINIFFLDNEDARVAHAAVDELPQLTRTSSLPCNIEITRRGIHKGFGLRWLCSYLGVEPKDTIAFGDSDNDLTMLEAAGDGVAMGNALQSCKEVADHIAPSCTDSGVARYLAPLFESQK